MNRGVCAKTGPETDHLAQTLGVQLVAQTQLVPNFTMCAMCQRDAYKNRFDLRTPLPFVIW